MADLGCESGRIVSLCAEKFFRRLADLRRIHGAYLPAKWLGCTKLYESKQCRQRLHLQNTGRLQFEAMLLQCCKALLNVLAHWVMW